MKGKPKRAQSWLPNQVAYGIDCSDPEPKNWKPFGELVPDPKATSAKDAPRALPKADHL